MEGAGKLAAMVPGGYGASTASALSAGAGYAGTAGKYAGQAGEIAGQVGSATDSLMPLLNMFP